MTPESFEQLIKRMAQITDVVNAFKSEQIQLAVFKALIGSLHINMEDIASRDDSEAKKKEEKKITKQARKNEALSKRTKSASLSIIKDLNLKPSGAKSIDDFMKDKIPSSHKEKITASVYYLERILKSSEISNSHIFTCFKHLKWRLPSNLQNMVAQTGTSGLIDTSDNLHIKVSTHGDNLIEHDLPKKEKSK